MRLFPLLLVVACYPNPSGDSSTVPATWQHVPLPERTLVDECDSVIRPASTRSAYDFGDVDAHQPVFGDRSPLPFHIHLGWPSSDPSTSISFVWHTDDETLATQVELTELGGSPVIYDGASYMHDRRVHEVRLCGGVEPNTLYSYRVGGEGNWSDTFTFTTPGPPNSFETFRVAMLGDSRGSYEEFGELMAGADGFDPDFFIFTGDMVNSGNSQYEWDAWFDAAGDILANKVLVPSHGNAEWLAMNYFAQFSAPNNEEWFSIRYGDLHLVSLNDTVRDMGAFGAQAQYMKDVFKDTPSAWRIAAHHQPIYTTNDSHAGHGTLLNEWTPVYDQYGVDLVLNGHNHFYERSSPIHAGTLANAGEGTVYIVSGGAGAPLYTSYHDDWFRRAVAVTEHYMIVDFGPNGIDGVAYDISGNVLDTWTIPR